MTAAAIKPAVSSDVVNSYRIVMDLTPLGFLHGHRVAQTLLVSREFRVHSQATMGT